ncbi:nickel-dependent lactate racemase [Paenibacillus athensensis]|uniref:Uncharacterized protein n=1 Tax=Paenibacillus athensensis TaxID=1967502 RepID=A0A4Y8PZ60_9BACL|nr:nickel-dependent lactate racemase [Paenibacillus athensensis]MCD1258496.1 nickel-dependent lactate racemase [Paenibacillus athensensis]
MYVLPYGKSSVTLELPPGVSADWISYRRPSAAGLRPVRSGAAGGLTADDAEISRALSAPIGAPALQEAARGFRSAVILISDMSRLCPSYVFLERLLDELNAAGIPDGSIRIIVALGMHRKMTADELAALVGPAAFRRVSVLNHSPLPEDCIRLGVTSRGVPVEINRLVVEAEFRMVTGNLEPHHLAGISGGVKALVPGVASAACIEANHALSAGSGGQAQPGSPDNAVRSDMEEALRFLPVHYLLNVVVDHERNLLGAVAGDVLAAHRAGLQLVRDCFLVDVPQRYELTVVSAGGFPKDTQLYQAVKSLKNAAAITRKGGRILLLAQCPELYGNGIFQFWIETIGDAARMTGMLRERFVLGAHKIESIAQVLNRHEVLLYSSVPDSTAELVGFHPISDLNAAVRELHSRCPRPCPNIALMPYGGLTFPQIAAP